MEVNNYGKKKQSIFFITLAKLVILSQPPQPAADYFD